MRQKNDGQLHKLLEILLMFRKGTMDIKHNQEEIQCNISSIATEEKIKEKVNSENGLRIKRTT